MSDNTIVIPLSKRGKYAGQYEAIVDEIDKDLAELNWHVSPVKRGNNLFYVKRRGKSENGSRLTLYLHRVIMERMLGRELIKGDEIDHINNNPLDNRRSNLRLATHRQNTMNTSIRSDNTSGYKGITWDKKNKKWRAQIQVNGKGITLGRYLDKEDAYKAYCEGATKYFGEFANPDTGE